MRSVVITPQDAATDEIIARYQSEPAPLLPILHALQELDGYLREAALAVVADRLKIEPGDLYGTVTFYHYFRLEPGHTLAYCDGPACRLNLERGGEGEIVMALGGDGHGQAEPIPCPGRCDRPNAVMKDGKFLEGCTRGRITGASVSPAADGPVILRHAKSPDQKSLAPARARGAYTQLARKLSAEEVIKTLEAAGLAGRGGAGFPAHIKWTAVRAAVGAPKYLVVNADEGEPATFKDRVILEHDPHLLIEGMAIAASAIGACEAFIYLRYEYPEALAVLANAINEATAAGLLGNLKIYLRRGAGAYICGEETSLLNSLEGKRPFPRDKPPLPVHSGLFGKPTLISNVETLAVVPRILELGAEKWKALGRNGKPGTKLYSLSGDVQRPGNYEAPFGITVRELIHDYGGGPRPGRTVQAFTMGGLSGGMLPASEIDLALDFDAPKLKGTMLGSGGLVVIDDSRCPVDLVRGAMQFFRDESCGKCFPCRVGSQRIVERLDLLATKGLDDIRFNELPEIAELMTRMSACGLGVAAPSALVHLLKWFPEEVAAHRKGGCARGVCSQRPQVISSAIAERRGQASF